DVGGGGGELTGDESPDGFDELLAHLGVGLRLRLIGHEKIVGGAGSGSLSRRRYPRTPMMEHRTMMGFRHDEAARQRRIDRAVMRRVFHYIRPYTAALVAFVVSVIAGAITTAIPPLLLRRVIDVAIPQHDRSMVMWIALAAVGLALANAALSLVQRYYSARIGEGLIYDLRVELFDHVQRMPIAFFTRTQTGALQSRLNNDVIGAQQAVTSTLGTV